MRPDSSEFRVKFQTYLRFQKFKKKTLFCEIYFEFKNRKFEESHFQAGYGRLHSVDLNCVHFWNQGSIDIFYHQTQKKFILKPFYSLGVI